MTLTRLLLLLYPLTLTLASSLRAQIDLSASSPSLNATEMRFEYGVLSEFTLHQVGDEPGPLSTPLHVRYLLVQPGMPPRLLGWDSGPDEDPNFSNQGVSKPGPGGTSQVRAYLFPPENVYGEYEIHVVIDPVGNFDETDETNNTLVLTPSIRLLRVPELDLLHIQNQLPRFLDAGEQFTVTTRITNTAGIVDIPPFLVDFYLVPPEEVGQGSNVVVQHFNLNGAHFLGRRQAPGLSIQQQTGAGYIDLTGTFGLPFNLELDTYRLGVILDAEDHVPEDRFGSTRTNYREVTNQRANDPSDVVIVNYVRERPDYAPLPSQTEISPTTTPAGEFVTFSGRVRNLTDYPGTELTTIHHSLSATSGPNVDRYLGTTLLPPIAANSFYDFDVSLRVPANLPSGEYRYIFVADAADVILEREERNNQDFTTPPNTLTVTPSVLPNLNSYVPNAGFSPTTVNTGGVMSVEIPITNSGNSPSGAFEVRITLSTDVIAADTDDITIHTFPFPGGIAAGATVEINTSVPIPNSSTLPPGEYRLAWRVDPADSVEESDEADNNGIILSPRLTVLPGPGDRPDLLPSEIEIAKTTVSQGTSYEFTLTLANDGATDAPASSLEVFLTTGPGFDKESAIKMEGATAAPIGSGDEITVQIGAKLPDFDDLPTGTYYFALIADSKQQIDEVNETNNTVVFIGSPLLVRPEDDGGLPNLGIVNASATPRSLTPGSTFSHVVTIFNAGQTHAGGVVTRVVLSTDDELGNADDILLASHGPDVVHAGETLTHLRDLRLPSHSDVPDGSYFLIWAIDPDSLVPETDEGDNVAKTTINIFSQPVRLTLYNSNPDTLLIGLENTNADSLYKIEYSYTLGKWAPTGVTLEGDPDRPIVVELPAIDFPEPLVDSLYLRAVISEK